jgi:uncharacterized protein YacL
MFILVLLEQVIVESCDQLRRYLGRKKQDILADSMRRNPIDSCYIKDQGCEKITNIDHTETGE